MTKSIPIHRLTTGSTITVIDPAWGRTAYIVENIEFDGYGYTVTYGDERGWSDTTYVDAGGSVDADGELRTDAEISFEEWHALNEVQGREIDRTLGQINEAQGYVPAPIDQRPLYEAVADALGVPAMAAAE